MSFRILISRAIKEEKRAGLVRLRVSVVDEQNSIKVGVEYWTLPSEVSCLTFHHGVDKNSSIYPDED